MVKITNNINTFEVSNGAYESIFKAQGYTKVVEETPEIEGQLGMEDSVPDMTEDEKFLSEIVEKPLSQWSKAEVKKYADLKGIDMSGVSTVAEAKELIKPTIS